MKRICSTGCTRICSNFWKINKKLGLKSATLLLFTCFRVWIFQVFAADLCKNLDSFLNASAQDDHETFYNTSCTIVLHMQDHWSSLDYLPYIKKNPKKAKIRSNFLSQWPYSSVFTCRKSTASFVWFSSVIKTQYLSTCQYFIALFYLHLPLCTCITFLTVILKLTHWIKAILW